MTRQDKRYLSFLMAIMATAIAGMMAFIHFQEKERNVPHYIVVRNHFGAPILCCVGTHIFYRSTGEVEFRSAFGQVMTPTVSTFVSTDPATLGVEPTRCLGGVYRREE